jgi:hypothetical protein
MNNLNNHKKISLIILIIILASISYSYALDFEVHERRCFRGVEDISVLVENLPESLKYPGLTREQLTTNIELRLRKANIRIRPQSDNQLYVHIMGTTLSSTNSELVHGYCFDVLTTFNQDAILSEEIIEIRDKISSDPNKPVARLLYKDRDFLKNFLAVYCNKVCTWKTGYFSCIGSSENLEKNIQEVIDKCIDTFINNYLAAKQDKEDNLKAYKLFLEKTNNLKKSKAEGKRIGK